MNENKSMIGVRLRGLSVGSRLRIAFYAVAGLSFAAAAVAFVSYSVIENAQRRIVEQAVPSMIVAEQLVQQTFVLTTSTSALASVTSQNELSYQTVSIEARLTELPTLIRRLRRGGTSIELVDSLNDLVAQLSDNRISQERQVVERITAQRQQRRQLDRAYAAVSAILDSVQPIVIEASSQFIENSDLLRENLRERQEVTEEFLQLFERVTGADIEGIEQLIELQFRAESLLQKLDQSLLEQNTRRLDSLKSEIDLDLRAMTRLTLNLEKIDLRAEVGNYLRDLSATISGANSIFQLGAMILEQNQRVDRLHQDIVKTSESINERAAALLEEAEQAITDETVFAGQAIYSSRVLLTVIVAMALIGSSLIITFIVSRQIVKRLETLTSATLALAKGDHEARISVHGSDELGALANAVRVFRNNSILLRDQEKELRRQTEALRVSEERFSLAAEGSSVGIWDWIDIKENEEYWSPNFYRLLGYDVGEIEASFETFKSLVHPDDLGAVANLVQAHFDDGVPFELEYRLRHKSGEYLWFQANGLASRNETGEPVRMVGSIADITQRKVTETRLALQSEDLKRSNTELAQFAYVASHDLKAPLRGIDNLATWIEADMGALMDGESQENMTLLRGRIARLEALLDDLLKFSRVGRKEEKVETVDVKSTIEGEFDLVMQGKRFALTLEGEFPVLETAKAPLHQIFRNLISNAIKHHDRDEGMITIGAEEQKECYLFSVRDDGPGIDPEFHERVFGVFQTLKGRDEVEGSGMGLAIVYKQLQIAGCSIEIESNPAEGRGTGFVFTWPKLWQSRVSAEMDKVAIAV
ncbi:PAS domain-containing protein [Denitrobaculum tricleocarpae]|uniref:histidine kinase n=1 Tax=Denitrobaculum tricleocarpae TaxID=2591009 RepID=A0A545TTT4_9PROT|nr:PAS domain-containing protein [Denitrobaculum tricleocarpae]TQV80626.1 PAS domain S-box protein [Denitrobaculum tricleocarpae]